MAADERCCGCSTGVAKVCEPILRLLPRRWRSSARSILTRPGTIHELVGDQMGVDLEECRTLDLSELLLLQDSTRSFGKHYKMIAQLGKGGFGSVYRATSLVTGEVRAVKVMSKSAIKKEIQCLATEIEVLIRLRHPNIISFYEFFEETKAICLVTELCDGGDFSKLNKFPLEQVRVLYRDVFNGVAYLHANGVAHRDLKFENCLLVDGSERKIAKVIDFGLAAIRREDEGEEWLNDKLGTKYFIAPEVIVKSTYGTKCDLWSLGVMVFITLTGQHPFADQAFNLPMKKLFEMILRAPMRVELLDAKKSEADARGLICSLLERIPDARMDCHAALAHEWLRPGCIRNELFEGMDRRRTSDVQRMADERMLAVASDTSRFQKLLLVLAAHNAKTSEVDNLRVAFMAQDKNGDGVLSLEEVRAGMRACGMAASDQDIERKFDRLDLDCNGYIHYIEWLSATLERSAMTSDEHMRAMFAYFDRDENGSISKRELLAFVDKAEADQILREADVSSDGVLDFEEFKGIVLTLAKLRDVERPASTASVR